MFQIQGSKEGRDRLEGTLLIPGIKESCLETPTEPLHMSAASWVKEEGEAVGGNR